MLEIDMRLLPRLDIINGNLGRRVSRKRGRWLQQLDTASILTEESFTRQCRTPDLHESILILYLKLLSYNSQLTTIGFFFNKKKDRFEILLQNREQRSAEGVHLLVGDRKKTNVLERIESRILESQGKRKFRALCLDFVLNSCSNAHDIQRFWLMHNETQTSLLAQENERCCFSSFKLIRQEVCLF